MTFTKSIKKFWKFLNEDTWQSWIVSLALLIALIYFVFFPTLSFITSSSLPLVVIESCSLYHDAPFDDWWFRNSAWYESHGITSSDFESFPFKNGLNKGGIIFVWGRSDYKIGDIIIFEPNPEATAKHPIIHRVVTLNPISTKGDPNPRQLDGTGEKGIDETNIPEERIIGKAVFKIPIAGWIKLVFFEPFRPAEDRGFCK